MKKLIGSAMILENMVERYRLAAACTRMGTLRASMWMATTVWMIGP